jgi:hypothetical protein
MHCGRRRSRAYTCQRSLFVLPSQRFTTRPVVHRLSFARFALPSLPPGARSRDPRAGPPLPERPVLGDEALVPPEAAPIRCVEAASRTHVQRLPAAGDLERSQGSRLFVRRGRDAGRASDQDGEQGGEIVASQGRRFSAPARSGTGMPKKKPRDGALSRGHLDRSAGPSRAGDSNSSMLRTYRPIKSLDGLV